MDFKEKILLGNKKNVISSNEDTHLNIYIQSQKQIIDEYVQNPFIDSLEVFEKERENVNEYRVYGIIEYLSLLNRLPFDYESISDLFIRRTGIFESKNIFNSFKIYLIIPNSEYEYVNNNRYLKTYKIIATPKHLNILKAGFSKNLFNEDKYYFDFQIDFDLSNLKDGLGFPITDAYLYFEYQPEGEHEMVYFNHGEEEYSLKMDVIRNINDILYNVSDVASENKLIGTEIKYLKNDYRYEILKEQTFRIKTFFEEGEIYWKYRPFYPIKLRHLSSTLNKVNDDTTSYDQKMSIPNYAIKLDDNNYIWREIIPDGETDPVTGVGVDFPFVNKKKYVFNNIIFSIQPDLDHENTFNVFEEIKFEDSDVITKRPNNENVDKIGKLC